MKIFSVLRGNRRRKRGKPGSRHSALIVRLKDLTEQREGKSSATLPQSHGGSGAGQRALEKAVMLSSEEILCEIGFSSYYRVFA